MVMGASFTAWGSGNAALIPTARTFGVSNHSWHLGLPGWGETWREQGSIFPQQVWPVGKQSHGKGIPCSPRGSSAPAGPAGGAAPGGLHLELHFSVLIK